MKLHILRSDRGGEYMSSAFTSYCNAHGIRRQLSVAYTQEQNGVPVRINRTLVEAARSILHDSGLPQLYWAEAIATAAYLTNIAPTTAVQAGKTPEGLWTGKKPDVSSLRIFGCLAYAHVPKPLRKKFDSKTLPAVLLGYSEDSKAYWPIRLANKELIIARDVLFDESKTFGSRTPLLKNSSESDKEGESVKRRLDNGDQVPGQQASHAGGADLDFGAEILELLTGAHHLNDTGFDEGEQVLQVAL